MGYNTSRLIVHMNGNQSYLETAKQHRELTLKQIKAGLLEEYFRKTCFEGNFEIYDKYFDCDCNAISQSTMHSLTWAGHSHSLRGMMTQFSDKYLCVVQEGRSGDNCQLTVGYNADVDGLKDKIDEEFDVFASEVRRLSK